MPARSRVIVLLVSMLTHRDERTRVIVRLVDVAADRHVWGDSFDGSVNDPFELEDHVVDGVLCGVVSRITHAEIERVHNKAPTDLGARDLALQALPLILGTSVPNARRAMAILNRAMELDAADATSMALLACCNAQLGTYSRHFLARRRERYRTGSLSAGGHARQQQSAGDGRLQHRNRIGAAS